MSSGGVFWGRGPQGVGIQSQRGVESNAGVITYLVLAIPCSLYYTDLKYSYHRLLYLKLTAALSCDVLDSAVLCTCDIGQTETRRMLALRLDVWPVPFIVRMNKKTQRKAWHDSFWEAT